MRILIAVDIFHPHDDLVEHVGWLLPIKGAEIILLFVKEILPSYERVVSSVGDFPDDWSHQIESRANNVFGGLREGLEKHGATVRTEIVSGPPAYMISEVEKDERVDVTVVAPWRRSKFQNFFLGSVSSKVVEITPAVNMILKDHGSANSLKHVLFAIDGSTQSLKALQRGAELLRLSERNAQVTVLTVVSVPAIVLAFTPVATQMAVENNMRLEAEKTVADGLAMLHEAGVKGEPRVEVGDPASRIIAVANDLNVELVVAGAKGHGAIEHMIMGTVADRIVKHVNCSVAIVH